MTKLKELVQYLEEWAPPSLQENYDNSGLITGNRENEIKGVLVSLDCTEEVVEEAIDKNCNVVIAHHPIIFKGLKTLTGSNYVERTIIAAIKNDIAIYAIHTNLDSINTGVNKKIAEKLKLKDLEVLVPKRNLKKLVTFIPVKDTDAVLNSIHKSGAGNIGDYSECSFRVTGTGYFKPSESANPSLGKAKNLESVEENRVEVILPDHQVKGVLSSLKAAHPYEEVAYFLSDLDNENKENGMGIIGYTDEDISDEQYLPIIKDRMNLQCIRHTKTLGKKVKKVAVCGGSGSFLLKAAKGSGAEIFITADFKYHEYFDAENNLVIADIGHYESEVFTKELIHDYICNNFTTFAVNLSNCNTNPIRYLI